MGVSIYKNVFPTLVGMLTLILFFCFIGGMTYLCYTYNEYLQYILAGVAGTIVFVVMSNLLGKVLLKK